LTRLPAAATAALPVAGDAAMPEARVRSAAMRRRLGRKEKTQGITCETLSVRWTPVCAVASTPPSWCREDGGMSEVPSQIQSHNLVKRINQGYLWGILAGG
jgi:hypothetical protein